MHEKAWYFFFFYFCNVFLLLFLILSSIFSNTDTLCGRMPPCCITATGRIPSRTNSLWSRMRYSMARSLWLASFCCMFYLFSLSLYIYWIFLTFNFCMLHLLFSLVKVLNLHTSLSLLFPSVRFIFIFIVGFLSYNYITKTLILPADLRAPWWTTLPLLQSWLGPPPRPQRPSPRTRRSLSTPTK